MSETNQNESNTTGTNKKLLFNVDERVLCFHGPLIYEAKILDRQWMEDEDPEELQGPHYYVHYKGWKNTWDEWVHETRVLRYTDTNLKLQQRLKEANMQKHAGKKRSRDIGHNTEEQEEEFLATPEIRLEIPDILKGQLVDDWEYVTKNQQLVILPREPTIRDILQRYKAQKLEDKAAEGTKELLDEVIDGIEQYFNKAIGSILLYRFERHQYARAQKKHPKKEMSEIYGAEHLLRLFVQLPSLISHTDMDADAVDVLSEYLTDILAFMEKIRSQIFLREYENASPEYVAVTNSI